MSSAASAHSVAQLLDELRRIDRLIGSAVARLRSAQPDADDFRGLYISEAEVDTILAGRYSVGPGFQINCTAGPNPAIAGGAIQEELAERVTGSQASGLPLRLPLLAERLGLTPFEIDILLICLAPELDLKYERLYAYLQDDVTRKRPTVDLVLNLLCLEMEAKLLARSEFGPNSPLIRQGVLHRFADPAQPQPPLLSHYLKVDERIVSYLLGSDDLDAGLAPFARRVIPRTRLDDVVLADELRQRLRLLIARHVADGPGLALYFQGPYGVGKQTTVEALCAELGLELIVVDGERALTLDATGFETTVRLIQREALLSGCALYWTSFDGVLAAERRAEREALLRSLGARPGLTILSGNTVWEPVDAPLDLPFVRIEFAAPGYAERIQLWSLSLNGDGRDVEEADLAALASTFRFTGGQIRDAAATARSLARCRDPQDGQVSGADLYTACRLHSSSALATLARKITPHYSWSDIVLPPDQMQHLREICDNVKYRALVYEQWGFDGKLSLGKGVNVLFAGPSGTGKTMAAEIMAGELGLDLYKIDLSSIVSKYIGETEKNLARIFAEAETSNVILFFDEADALFGKRSEVRDSHDRYANIEVSYLLQRMEEYEGIVILATNLRKNMDEAFVRRLQFTVEFPFPGDADRRRIWEGIWPRDTPRDAGVDLRFMAQRFEFAGGAIRNIALAAAFRAAADGGIVSMDHLLDATRREYQKIGKIVAEEEFSRYAAQAERR